MFKWPYVSLGFESQNITVLCAVHVVNLYGLSTDPKAIEKKTKTS